MIHDLAHVSEFKVKAMARANCALQRRLLVAAHLHFRRVQISVALFRELLSCALAVATDKVSVLSSW